MKDMFDLINEVDITEEEMEIIEMETNDIEKARVTKNLKDKIKVYKKDRNKKKNIMVASLASIFIASSIFVVNENSIFASEIPVIKDIFEFFGYQEFKENSNEVNFYSENKKDNIILNEVVSDGNHIFLTYTIKTYEPIEYLNYLDLNLKCKTEGIQLNLLSNGQKRIDDYTFVGTAHIQTSKFADNIKFDLEIKDLRYFDFDENLTIEENVENNFKQSKQKTLKGKWNFNVEVKALQGKNYDLNYSIKDEKTNLQINFSDIFMSPIAFNIKFDYNLNNINEEYKLLREMYPSFSVELKVTDDLGNEYESLSNGGSGKNNILNYEFIFNKLDPNAKKLYVKPYYYVSTNGGEAIIDKNSNSQTIEYKKDKNFKEKIESIELETVEIELSSLK